MSYRALSALRRSSSALRCSGASRIPQRGGGGHSWPPTKGHIEPPIQRTPLPRKDLLEEDELIWNDGVAPETALDFDAPHVSKWEGLAWWLGSFLFVYLNYKFISSFDIASMKKTAPREVPESTRVAEGLYEDENYAKGPELLKRAE
eukprot:gb/GECG01006254.1/.p1 GENE.gb/GECG01006254.1/~~gb/GECG01006254.1/.p1  ORF type:complete len:147 (+),score=20.97 gb/GECG01006254.1/:1-441(+)